MRQAPKVMASTTSTTAAVTATADRPAQADVTLRPATHDDIPALASISDAAFQADSHTQLKASIRGDDDFPRGMQEALASWINHPKVDVIVAEEATTTTTTTTTATSDGTPKLVGWVGWVRRGFAGDTDLPLAGPDEEPRADTFFTGSRPGGGGDEKKSKTVDDLGALTNASMEYWVKRFMPEGCKCRFLCTYVVHPDHQARGIGSRMMKWGTDQADREPGVYCWVQSSMGGQPAFEKQGFYEVGRLEADLDEFAEGRRPGGELEHVTGSKESWGRYSWVYMRRDAKA
ncbi:acetyltransferase [Colletotrichum orchidophilum]|uniref:Acetyltransferase n=1 Tax=Colletotrichum orchidophilum TaxID=1209926 RepID=A0A1G4BLB7_9PEZI|nr:acetyltransferase [Colletotrichum orchidophilum]OHF02087.1 acetyltransferase [Colletotrichum orchidophilum]